MTTFVHCRGCGQQIHETAPTCPKCGAPQLIATAGSVPSAYQRYADVPWYRRRWFAIVSIMLFVPLFLLIAFTGDVYFQKKGRLVTMPRSARITVLTLFILLIVLNIARS